MDRPDVQCGSPRVTWMSDLLHSAMTSASIKEECLTQSRKRNTPPRTRRETASSAKFSAPPYQARSRIGRGIHKGLIQFDIATARNPYAAVWFGSRFGETERARGK